MLSDVLSRLPISDAVRTSALSRAWRRRWESVPYLTFSWPRHTPPGAITAVLRRCSGPVRKFSNLHVREASVRHSDRWLLLLARKKISDLRSIEKAIVDCAIYTDDRDFIKLITGLSRARELEFVMPAGERNASNINTLHIELFDDPLEIDEADTDFLNGQWTDDLFSNLRSVYVRNMTCK
uniref:F-box domain-containing protein n=1 Tax=Oryza punctata TaxID=4537 RepID=A0A0E0LVM9_ORYPU